MTHILTECKRKMVTITTNEPAAMLTPEGAATVAETSISTIWRAVRAGKLPFYRRGKRDTRFLPADVTAFKRSRSRAA
jgi:excisionase family DNA binding protein